MFVPDQLKWDNVKPQGWYSRFKQWPVQPLSSNQYWQPNEIVRFLVSLTAGVMDPYRSHLVMKVGAPTTMTTGGLQVDNSAQSFISQLVVSSRNQQIQRITQYDTLAAYLTDIGFSQVVCQNRQWQGLGYTNYQHGIPHGGNSTTLYSQGIMSNTNNAWSLQQLNSGVINPLGKISGTYGIVSGAGTSQFNCNDRSTVFSPSNILAFQPNTTTMDVSQIANDGMLTRIRAEYNSRNLLQQYPDSTTSFLTTHPTLNSGLTSAIIRAGTNAGQGYNITYKQALNAQVYSGAGILNNFTNIPNTAQFWGFDRPISSKFATGCGQPMISTTIPQCQFGYGVIASAPVPVPVRKFSFPIMSTVIGVLIPSDQFCLLPLACLYDTLLQFTMSPWAMFTTGLLDQHQWDVTGSASQQTRSWQITEIYYNLHIYQFPDDQLQRYITQSISKQITITGSSWMLSAQYQIPTGATVRGNWQINVASQFLGQVIVLFLSNEYMKYSYCRKQFRLSHNIRSLQLKFNTDFYPAQPIVGNAGCPVMIDNSGDNSQFMQYLLQTYNYKFVTNVPQPRINSYNFAVNSRCYTPSSTGPLYKNTLMFAQNNPANWTQANINYDTAMGMPWFHQNRFVGRAAFVYSFEAHGHSKNYMVGADSRNARPFEINFDSWATNVFPTDSTMYVFTRSNAVVVYGRDRIRVLGR